MKNKRIISVKNLSMSILLILLFVVFAFSGCNGWRDYVYEEGDFLLEVEVDKQAVSVGDTITVTASLTNTSGRDIAIRLLKPWDTGPQPLETIILMEFAPIDVDVLFSLTRVGGRRPRRVIRNGMTITRIAEFTVVEQTNYILYTAVFSLGVETQNLTSLGRTSIEILVE